MLGIVGVWPPKHGEIIKSEMSNGRRTKLLLSVVEFTYDWLRFEGYLGNVGLAVGFKTLYNQVVHNPVSAVRRMSGRGGWHG